MTEEPIKEQLIIKFEDLNDFEKTLTTLCLCCNKIIEYYAKQNDRRLDDFVLEMSAYFGYILQMLGFDEEDFKDGK